MLDDHQHAYLGAVICDPSTLDAHPLDAADFTGAGRNVFLEMCRLHSEGVIPDYSTMKDLPAWRQIGADVLSYAFTAANVGFYAKKLKEATKLRCYSSIGGLVTEMQERGASAEEIGTEINRYLAISDRSAAQGITAAESVRYVIKQLERKGIKGLPTGFSRLDNMLSGLQPSGLYVLAGRPGMGKSALAGNLVEFLAPRQKKIVVFTLEMCHEQWTTRTLLSQANVNADRCNEGKLTNQDYTAIINAASKVSDWGMKLYDQPAIRVDTMRSITRREKPDLVIVDYLQLATAPAEKRHEEVATISRGLKALAKENRVPVLALAQMNRGSEAREKKRPMLSDLRESGQIEQDADAVMFIYRPSYYCDDCKLSDGNDCGKPGHGTGAEIIVAKNRHGKAGIVQADFYGEHYRFEERLP